MTKLEELKADFDRAFLLADKLNSVARYAEYDMRGYGAVEAWDSFFLACNARDNAWDAYLEELKAGLDTAADAYADARDAYAGMRDAYAAGECDAEATYAAAEYDTEAALYAAKAAYQAELKKTSDMIAKTSWTN